MRTLALLTVLALTAPSVGALVCDVACAARHESSAAAPASGSCHDHGAPQPDSPNVSAAHACHAMGIVPASIMRDAGSQLAVAPAIVHEVQHAADGSAGRETVARRTRLTNHAPPLLILALRI
jgi:hypothetical protein